MRNLSSDSFLRLIRMQIVAVLVTAAMAIPAPAQFSSLVSFNGTNGMAPQYGPLVQGRDGAYYGTASGGGIGGGTVFKVTSNGTVTVLYNFCSQPNCADGNSPIA